MYNSYFYRNSTIHRTESDFLNIREKKAITHFAIGSASLRIFAQNGSDLPLFLSPLASPFFRHAFWCLGLVGSTSRGAELLQHLGWSALRSDRLDKWPLQLPQWEVSARAPALPGQCSRFFMPRNSDASSLPGGGGCRRDTRTESMTSSCGSESRRSTNDPAGMISSGNGDWAAWLGNGTSTVRSLGRDIADSALAIGGPGDGDNASDVRGYATLSHVRGRAALSASGSVHDLGGGISVVTVEPALHHQRQNSEVGSLSSIFTASNFFTSGSQRHSQPMDYSCTLVAPDESRRVKK